VPKKIWPNKERIFSNTAIGVFVCLKHRFCVERETAIEISVAILVVEKSMIS